MASGRRPVLRYVVSSLLCIVAIIIIITIIVTIISSSSSSSSMNILFYYVCVLLCACYAYVIFVQLCVCLCLLLSLFSIWTASWDRASLRACVLRPISLLRLSLLRLLDSNFTGNSLWAWEFHPFKSRLCLSQTLWTPEY